MNEVVYVVMQYMSGNFPNCVTGVVGVMTSEDKALEACKGHDNYYIGL